MWKKAFRYSVFAGLGVGFLVMVLIGVDELQSDKTSVYSTQINDRKTPVPSFTICPFQDPAQELNHDQVLTALGNGSQLASLNFTASYFGKNLLDPETLKSEFNLTWNDAWSVNCKFYSTKKCSPCVTFKSPETFNLTDTQWLTINLMEPNKTYGTQKSNGQFFLDFHEASQSLTLGNRVDFSKSGYFKLKRNYTGITVRNARLVEKAKLNLKKSPCDEFNGMELESLMTKWIIEEIKCNLPWSKYKSELYQDCKDDSQMEAYFDFASRIDEKTKEKMPPQNCYEKFWKISDYYTDYTSEKSNDSAIKFMLLAIGETVDHEIEVKQYGFSDFIADFGGYLGLLLGGSIPSLLTLLEEYFSLFMKKLKTCSK